MSSTNFLERKVSSLGTGYLGTDAKGRRKLVSFYHTSSDEEFIERATRIGKEVLPGRPRLFRGRKMADTQKYCEQYKRGFKLGFTSKSKNKQELEDNVIKKHGPTDKVLLRWFTEGVNDGFDYEPLIGVPTTNTVAPDVKQENVKQEKNVKQENKVKPEPDSKSPPVVNFDTDETLRKLRKIIGAYRENRG